MKLSQERKFGLTFSVVFLFLSFWFLKKNTFVVNVFIFLFITVFSATIFKPNLLKFLNSYWIKLGEILGKIISPIVMMFIYFIIIFPIGLILKILKKDILNLKTDKKAKTYWIKRKKDIGSMDKQF